jgi:hypothetical protein
MCLDADNVCIYIIWGQRENQKKINSNLDVISNLPKIGGRSHFKNFGVKKVTRSK